MADQLTAAGLETTPLDTRINEVIAELRLAISESLDASVDQPTGQFLRITLEHLQRVVELAELVHDSSDPDQATGVALEALWTNPLRGGLSVDRIVVM